MERIHIPQGLASTRQRLFNRSIGNSFAVYGAEGETEIAIYDEIGFFGVSAEALHERLSAINTPRIRLLLNSPGGDAFDGITMFNDLVNHPAEVHVEVRGLAASAASIIAMAGDRITMAENAFMMIHNAWGLAIGDKGDMLAFHEVLEKVDGALARTYANRTGLELTELSDMMDRETWLDAGDALEKGFADETSGAAEAQALFDLAVFANVPTQLKRDIEARLRAADFSQTEAKAAIAKGFGELTQRDVASASQRDVVDDTAVRSALEKALTIFQSAAQPTG